MGLLNIFKSKGKAPSSTSAGIPPPPPLEGLPTFPAPEQLKKEKKGKKQEPSEPVEPVGFDKRSLSDREAMRLSRDEQEVPDEPIFMGLDEYREMVDELSQLKMSLDQSLEVVGNLEELKHTEDAQFDKWKKQVKDIHNKLIFIDHTLFEKS